VYTPTLWTTIITQTSVYQQRKNELKIMNQFDIDELPLPSASIHAQNCDGLSERSCLQAPVINDTDFRVTC
jgi:hypothetical protein